MGMRSLEINDHKVSKSNLFVARGFALAIEIRAVLIVAVAIAVVVTVYESVVFGVGPGPRLTRHEPLAVHLLLRR